MPSEDTTITQAEVIQLIRDAVEANGGSQQITADRWGISPQYMNDLIRNRREPGRKVLDALGLRKEIQYVKKDAP